MLEFTRFRSQIALFAVIASLTPLAPAAASAPAARVKHVVVISIDGLHAIDLSLYTATHPNSTLAVLAQIGVTYTHASTPVPSDSIPGTLALFTGGTPKTTGIYYDNSYDRALLPPAGLGDKPGAPVYLDESIDRNPNLVDAGGGLDPATFDRDPKTGKPLWPHQLLRVNTVFEVVHAAGGRTAWSDKHPAYEILDGPSGKGIDDLYCPEIAAGRTDRSVTKTEAYDDDKVRHLVALIHSGGDRVPELMGLNLQAEQYSFRKATLHCVEL